MKKFIVFAIATLGATAAMAAGCIDGTRGSVTKYDTNNDHSYSEVRICKNGTYMTDEEKAAYIYNPKVGCVEGAKGSVTKFDRDGDRSYTEFRTCKNGSYMNDAERAAYIRNPKSSCKEGRFGRAKASDYGLTPVFGRSDDNEGDITTICRNNKWVPYNN